MAAAIAETLEGSRIEAYYIYVNTERNPADYLTRLEKLGKLFELYPEIEVARIAGVADDDGLLESIRGFVYAVMKWINRFNR